ncbi:MAG: hypothetical protein PHI35_09555, partial [Victivallaceae bacterium]|nr:hypothetical protein [Victivallaceae bacterium]
RLNKLHGPTPRFTVRPVAVVNTGRRVLTPVSVMFQLFPMTPHAELDKRSVPYYFRRAWRNVWFNSATGERIGAYFPLHAGNPGAGVRFWLDDNAQPHPDASWPLPAETRIAPGETLMLADEPALEIFYLENEAAARRFLDETDRQREVEAVIAAPDGRVMERLPHRWEFPLNSVETKAVPQ